MTSSSETFKLFLLRHGQSNLNHENIFCGWIDAKLTEKGENQARNTAKLIQDYCQTNNVTLPQIGYSSRLIRTQQTMDVILEQFNLKGDKHIICGGEKTSSRELAQIPLKLLPSNTITNDKSDINEVSILQTWRLNERHYGSWQGQRKPQILQQYGDEQYMYIRRDFNGRPPKVDLNLEMVQEIDDKGSSTGYEFKEPNRHLKYGLEESNNEPLPCGESLCDVGKRLGPFLDNVVLKIAKDHHLDSSLIVGHGSTVRSALKMLEGISDEEIKGIDIPNGIPLVIELDRASLKFVRRFYLDPESAKINAEKVRKEGFENNP
ncbi:uncharacterized protein NDAI_0G02990 [Naumovozyma dairenensis CBS 421]|uniref:Phosphoglycerate mutase n=1 Tax=Naumovozyma dairenensis (strain ATCC 10597 / BCRC 20456 / CBS 421 / NBRC 0211 / NRRL Y-12639) TaxID=1071378 RepID=G0WE65_NAUDC|nr:hypothetical protein NDAI_0G02990 [Naumovozyma dairenensis CBS 421]CCD26076.2 hypothetical protein NDAI_0G02990 [Naumovozyma dairenensis CBS 421]